MSVIDELLDLQEQDSVIKSLEKQVHDIPKRRKLEQEKLDDYQRELDQAREALDRAQRVEAQSQLDSDQQAAQIAKYEKQRQEVKTNNEYAALGRQIDSCRRVKAEYDDRVAKAREHIEAVQENIAMFAGMILFVGFNYIGQRFFVFRDKEEETPAPETEERKDDRGV